MPDRELDAVGLGKVHVLDEMPADHAHPAARPGHLQAVGNPAQLLDILIFRLLRRSAWWRAPLISSAVASAVDTLIFFWLLFGVFFPEWGLDWVSYGIGDYAVKASMALVLLVPYRVLMARYAPPPAAA